MRFSDTVTLDLGRARAATADEIRDCACSRNDSPAPHRDASPDPDASRRRWLHSYADESPFMGVAENPADYVPLAQQLAEVARANQVAADLQRERDEREAAERQRLAEAARNAGAVTAREAALESARQANAAAVAAVMGGRQ